jgi:hypothetical protein
MNNKRKKKKLFGFVSIEFKLFIRQNQECVYLLSREKLNLSFQREFEWQTLGGTSGIKEGERTLGSH